MKAFKQERDQYMKAREEESEEEIEGSSNLSLLECLGYNSKLHGQKAMILDVVNDTTHISQGANVTIGPNTNILIQMPEGMTIHDFMTYAIAFNLSLTNFPVTANHIYGIMNALTLFRPLLAQFGKKSYPIAGCDQYHILNMLLMNKALIEPFAYGMALDIDNYANFVNGYGAGPVPAYAATSTSGYDYTTNGFAPLFQQAMRQSSLRFNGGNGVANTAYPLGQTGGSDTLCIVPLMFLFPSVLQNLCGYSLISDLSQIIKFQLVTNTANRCVFDMAGLRTDGTYTMTNISLVRQYKDLDQYAVQKILSSKVSFPVRDIIPYPLTPITGQNNLVFSIGAGERASRLIFAFAPSAPGTTAGLPMLTNAQLLAPHFMWSDMCFFPSLPVQLVTVKLGGDTFNFNSQNIQVLQMLQGSQGHNGLGDCNFYPGGTVVEGIMKQVQCAYCIDLSPYPISLTGNDDQGQVQIRVDVNLTGFNEMQSSTQFTGTSVAQLTIYAFLEKIKPMELENGVYK